MIEWEFSVDKEQKTDHVQVIGWNFAGKSKEAQNAAERLWKKLEGQRARLDEECTGDEVEREAEWCQETLGNFLDAKPKKNKNLRPVEEVVER